MKNIFLFFGLINIVYAQSFSSRVLNSATKEPIPFVNIGVLNKAQGTVSNETGHFSLTFKNLSENDTLKISSIGCKSKFYLVNEILKSRPEQVFLEEEIINLPKLVVNPINYKLKKFGVDTRSKTVQIGFAKELLGQEIGIVIKNNKRANIESIFMNFSFCSYDSLIFRVNFYSFKGIDKLENILIKPIIVSISKKEAQSRVEINLKDFNVNIQGDFLVSVEHIKVLGKGELLLSSKFGGKSYGRATSHSKWAQAPFRVSVGVTAMVEK